MLSKVYEWYRVVNASPADDIVTKRTATVSALVDAASKEKAPGLFLELCSVATNGFDGQFDQESRIVKTLVEAVRLQQPAFPQDLAENQLELRVCAALTLGEILDRSRAPKARPSPFAILSGSLLVAGLVQKPVGGGKHLRTMLADLGNLAQALLHRGGNLRRERVQATAAIEKAPEGGDIPSFWKHLQPMLKNAVSALESNATVDREELNVLWWAQNGYSDMLDTSYADAPIGLSTLCCGSELADLVELPPLPAMRNVIRRTMLANRNEKSLPPVSIRDCIKDWDPAKVGVLIPKHSEVVGLVRNNPSLFPLSWSCTRFQESAGKASWLSEVKKLGWDPDHKLTPTAFALQAFAERVAQRLYQRFF